jgi:hypothetical protein
MSRAHRAWGLSALAIAAILAGCEQGDVDGTVGVSIAPGALTGPMADPGTPVVDDDGFAHLDLYPLFVTVRIEAGDLEAPVLGSWPDEVPETAPEEILLDVAVAPGLARQITVEALTADDDGRVATFRSPAPGRVPTLVDVVSRETTDVDIELIEMPTGIARATWAGATGLEALAWVDAAAKAVLPAAEPVDGVVETVLTVGRIYWPRVVTMDGETIDMTDQVVELTNEAEIAEVTLDISE